MSQVHIKLWQLMANISDFLKLNCLFWMLPSIFPLIFIYKVNIKPVMKGPESLEAEILYQVCSRWYSIAEQITRCFPTFNLNISNSKGASLFSSPFKIEINLNFNSLFIGRVTAGETRLPPLCRATSTTQLITLMCKSPCSNTHCPSPIWFYPQK